MKNSTTLENAKTKVVQLVGRPVTVKLNRGRNKVKSYNGVVSEAHSNVFVVCLQDELFDRISCSYTDMLCGEVQLTESL